MSQRTLRIATRQSPLALWQANHVRELLLKQWPEANIELLPMTTSGDKFLKDKLLAVGGKGLFVKELEEALLDERADLAVHSTKDMPATFPEGLALAAICTRDNPLDAFLSKEFSSLAELPQHALVGTASLRRQSQLLAYRPDLRIQALRGNVNTRLAKLEAGEYQAIILAAAGLERMGLEHEIKQVLPTEIMLPACGQGALCIECRTDDAEMQQFIACLNDPITALCVNTERLVNAQLGGNCHVPLAVYCSVFAKQELFLQAKIGSLDGKTFIQDKRKGSFSEAELLATQCTESLLAQGAANLLNLNPS
ncbi:MAG: hydroxymethylbilane synthase [Legionella sp.]|nr:MAG: hydroxymethylbilane synthase [Legionella sp.]